MEARTLLWGIPPPLHPAASPSAFPKPSTLTAGPQIGPSPRLPAWLSSTADVHRGVALDDWIPRALQRAREEERRWEWPWQRACVTKVLCLWRAYIYCRCPCGFIHVQAHMWVCVDVFPCGISSSRHSFGLHLWLLFSLILLQCN